MSIEETLTKLVAINSVSGNSNREIIEYLSARVEKMGMRARLLPYNDERGIEKVNMIAVAGTDSFETEVELALVGHTDTVPFDAAWTEALKLTPREGRLYGRGACDTKAYIAAALTVAEGVDLKSLRRPLALIFTADEEVGCMGAKKLEEARAVAKDETIVAT